MAAEFFRFWAFSVLIGDGCWEWQRGTDGSGYGSLRINGRKVSAHRTAWQMWHGPVPAGLCVLHRCDNRRCVRPDHLFLGTKKENAEDRDTKGRNGFSKHTTCPQGHLFDETNTYVHRTSGARVCRLCSRDAMRRHRERRALR